MRVDIAVTIESLVSEFVSLTGREVVVLKTICPKKSYELQLAKFGAEFNHIQVFQTIAKNLSRPETIAYLKGLITGVKYGADLKKFWHTVDKYHNIGKTEV